MNIALCMIVRNGAADGLERAIESARPYVDEVCVWENDSTDDTIKLLNELATKPGAPIRVERGTWADNFAAAREASFAMTDADWIIHFDANDELRGGENLSEAVARAEAADADVAWAAFDHQANPDTSAAWYWWPRVVRRGSGAWLGRVHEHWMRPGIDRWRCGLGQPGSVYAHPARLSLYHHDRAPQPALKYARLLELAADDLKRTPWALRALGDQFLNVGDDARAVECWSAYLNGKWDRCEGTPNSWRAHTLWHLARASIRLGKTRDTRRYSRAWGKYTPTITTALGVDRARFLAEKLTDDAQVSKWAAMKPRRVDLLLDVPA